MLRVLRLRFPELTKPPGKEVMLKWPNDLVLSSGEKLGGILCEKVESGVIAGIGLNLTTAPSIDGRACSSLGELLQEAKVSGFEITRDPPSSSAILEMILEDLGREPSLEGLRADFLSVSIYPLGHAIQWQDSQSGGLRKGRMLGLGLHGELQVELPDGKTQALFSEEIAGIRNESDSDKK
jgi:BirA family biotin operon repressor/biotin-[acetyl-CoA-carboxylase] ligase